MTTQKTATWNERMGEITDGRRFKNGVRAQPRRITCLAGQIHQERSPIHVDRQQDDAIGRQRQARNVLVVFKRKRKRRVLNKVEHGHAVANRGQPVSERERARERENDNVSQALQLSSPAPHTAQPLVT